MERKGIEELRQLKIDHEFKAKIPPLSDDEYEQLEKNIIKDKIVRDPLITWNGLIVDGHHRYSIILRHYGNTKELIPYTTQELKAKTREDVLLWICENQLGRRNLTDTQRSYLIGQLYEKRKKPIGGPGRGHKNAENCSAFLSRTSGKIGKEYGITERTVIKAAKQAKGIDAIGKVDPELKQDILTEKVVLPKKTLEDIGRLSQESIPAVVEKIQNGERKSVAVREVEAQAAISRDPNRVIVYTKEKLLQELNGIWNDALIKTDRVIHMDRVETATEFADAVKADAEEFIKQFNEMIHRKGE